MNHVHVPWGSYYMASLLQWAQFKLAEITLLAITCDQIGCWFCSICSLACTWHPSNPNSKHPKNTKHMQEIMWAFLSETHLPLNKKTERILSHLVRLKEPNPSIGPDWGSGLTRVSTPLRPTSPHSVKASIPDGGWGVRHHPSSIWCLTKSQNTDFSTLQTRVLQGVLCFTCLL